MIVMVAPHTSASRIGYTVSRRVGNAVVRNRVRRRLKEIVRLSQDGLAPQVDYVVIAFPTAAKQSYDVLRMELLCLLKRIKARRPAAVSQPQLCSQPSPCIG
jgi:ribonuclease P protein component